MGGDEIAMRASIWLALALYTVGEISRLRWRGGQIEHTLAARTLWSIGFALYVIHVLLAFGIFHHWSHSAAYTFTADETEALIGWRWGGGLFVNYLFSAVWLAELVCWSTAPVRYRGRARWIDLSVRLFFAFMIANGAVVFVQGPGRLLGIAITAALLFGFYKFRR